MRLIDLMAPEMRSIKQKRQIILERRQMPPLRLTSSRFEREGPKERIKKCFPVLLNLLHTKDVERVA